MRDAAGAAKLFALRIVHLLRFGKETTQLGSMALRAAEIHEERTQIGLVVLLTPAITVVRGALVADIVAAMLLAILSLNDLVGRSPRTEA